MLINPCFGIATGPGRGVYGVRVVELDCGGIGIGIGSGGCGDGGGERRKRWGIHCCGGVEVCAIGGQRRVGVNES